MISGLDPSEDPQRFLDDVAWMCRALGYSSTQIVEFVAFQLRDVARDWYETMLCVTSEGSPPLVWDEFIHLFYSHFLPKSVHLAGHGSSSFLYR